MWFDLTGTLDPKGLLLSASKQELIRSRLKVCELLSQECELQSQKVSDWEVGGGHGWGVLGVGVWGRGACWAQSV